MQIVDSEEQDAEGAPVAEVPDAGAGLGREEPRMASIAEDSGSGKLSECDMCSTAWLLLLLSSSNLLIRKAFPVLLVDFALGYSCLFEQQQQRSCWLLIPCHGAGSGCSFLFIALLHVEFLHLQRGL